MAMVKFGNIVRDVKINVDRSNNPYKHYVAGDHMDSEDLTIHRHGDFATDDVGPAFTRIFKPGQILYGSRRTYLKKIAVADFSGICANTTFVLESKNETVFLTRLLPFIMLSESFTRWSIAHSKGSTNPYVLFSDLADYEFDLPPIEEQRMLADKLWAAYRLRDSYKKLLTATQEMVKSQFIEMFTDKGYPLTMIKSFADVSTGGTPSKAHPEYWNGDKPWVSAEDMKSKYVYDTCEKVTEAGYATCKIIPVDTLMYVCRGSIGVMAINKIECATNQSICRATCHNNVCNVEFLYHALMYQRDNIKKKGTGTSFKSLNQTTFSELEIELPPHDEQMKFVTIAEQADKSEFELRKSIEAIDQVIKSLINNK